MNAAALVLLLVPTLASSGVIPSERSVDWSVAGYPGDLPRPTSLVDASAYGAVGDGATPAQAAISAAIAALGGGSGVVFLPAGTYRITGSVALKSGVVLRGAGAESTRIACDLPNSGTSCLVVAGTTVGAARPVVGGLAKGSTQLQLNDTTGLAPGDWAELRQANGSWDTQPADWAKKVVGQIVEIVAVEPGAVTIAHPLRITYEAALAPELLEVAPAKEVGVESLGLDRLTDPNGTGGGNNIQFTYAVRSWVIGIDSHKSIGSHVGVFRSSQIEVFGSVFEDAFTFDGSATRGYGVTLNDHSGECLIEGNVFGHLRHAMMVKTGANGNVFAYNWSRDPYRSEPFQDFAGDISVHGHWPFANLFEGNVVANIIIDQAWGPAGPHNTFFRNRAELYGLIMTPESPSNDQNFVGNEVTKGKTDGLLGLYYTMPWGLKGTGHLSYGNNVAGKTEPAGTSALTDVSYYRSGDGCAQAAEWPAIGYPNTINSKTVRAELRGKAPSGRTTLPLWVSAGPDLTLMDGESASLTGTAGGGNGALNAAWSPELGLETPGALDTTGAPWTSTVYTLTVTDADGCALADEANVTVMGAVAAPTLSPEPGTYLGPLSVSASCVTPDATIRVTTDGTEPTEADAAYGEPLSLAVGATVRARAFKVDFTPSEVVEATYTLDPDECVSGNNNCANEAICTNTLGGFVCVCPAGFDGDGTVCTPWPAGDTCDAAVTVAATTWSGSLADAHAAEDDAPGTGPSCLVGVDMFLALELASNRVAAITLTPDAATRVGLELWTDCAGGCGDEAVAGADVGDAVYLEFDTGSGGLTRLRIVGLDGTAGAVSLLVEDVTPAPVDPAPDADVTGGEPDADGDNADVAGGDPDVDSPPADTTSALDAEDGNAPHADSAGAHDTANSGADATGDSPDVDGPASDVGPRPTAPDAEPSPAADTWDTPQGDARSVTSGGDVDTHIAGAAADGAGCASRQPGRWADNGAAVLLLALAGLAVGRRRRGVARHPGR